MGNGRMYLHALIGPGILIDRLYTLGMDSEDTLHRDWFWYIWVTRKHLMMLYTEAECTSDISYPTLMMRITLSRCKHRLYFLLLLVLLASLPISATGSRLKLVLMVLVPVHAHPCARAHAHDAA